MILALVVSLLAGLATSVGGLLAMHRRTLEREVLAVALAFAAGAMLLVSFVQILPLGIEWMAETQPLMAAQAIVYLAFFAGIALVLIIDRFLPSSMNPSEIEGREAALTDSDATHNLRLLRSGLLVAMVLGLHNFPEGMATFFTTYQDPTVGITLAVAIAIHNVPEGISWVVPDAFFGIFYGLVAGMMVFLALDELLQASWRYQTDKHQTIYGMLAGMAIVVVSLVLFTAA